LDFETGRPVRDRIGAIKNVIEGQKIAAKVSGTKMRWLSSPKKIRLMSWCFCPRGKLIGRESFVLTGANAEEPKEIMTSFVKQYYASASYIRRCCYCSTPLMIKMPSGLAETKKGAR